SRGIERDPAADRLRGRRARRRTDSAAAAAQPARREPAAEAPAATGGAQRAGGADAAARARALSQHGEVPMRNLTLPALAAIAVAFIVMSVEFVIDQAEQDIIVQFGEPIGGVIDEPGLHFRVPFIQEVRRFDKRLLDWVGDVSQIPTLGREFIIVDTTARWRISDPLQFLRSVRDEQGAHTRLDDILDSVVRDIVSGTELEEIVRSADWQVDVSALAEEEIDALAETDLERPTKGRAQLEEEMLEAASRLMPGLGIELVDVRIKRINY